MFPGAKSVYYKDRELNGNPATLPLPVPYGRTDGYRCSDTAHFIPEAVEQQVHWILYTVLKLITYSYV